MNISSSQRSKSVRHLEIPYGIADAAYRFGHTIVCTTRQRGGRNWIDLEPKKRTKQMGEGEEKKAQ